MNRRDTRVREYYGYALIAGIPVSEAKYMTPGFIRDMFKIRAEYDARMNGAKIKRKTGL